MSQRNWAYEQGTLWVIDLAQKNAPLVQPRIPTVFNEIRDESIQALATAMGWPHSEPVRRRLNKGRRCFAGWVGGQLAAYGWVSQRAECIGELEREIQLEPAEAYIWDCVTLPAYRRQRLYSALLSHMLIELHGEGMRRVWIGSSMANKPSIRGFANAGFQPVITLTYVRLFKVRCSWIGGYPGAPPPLVAAARRALTTPHDFVWGALAVSGSQPGPWPLCSQSEG